MESGCLLVDEFRFEKGLRTCESLRPQGNCLTVRKLIGSVLFVLWLGSFSFVVECDVAGILLDVSEIFGLR
jgi:hypothetical protein